MWPTYKPISWDKYYAHNFNDKHASITSGLAAGITIGVFFTVFLLTFGCRIYSRRTAADATVARHNAEVARLRRRPSVSQLFCASPPPPYELAIQMPKPANSSPCGHFAFEPPPSFSELPPVEESPVRQDHQPRSMVIASLPAATTTPSNGVAALRGSDSSQSLKSCSKIRENSPPPTENAIHQIPLDERRRPETFSMKNRKVPQQTSLGTDATTSHVEFHAASRASSSNEVSDHNEECNLPSIPSSSSTTLASVCASIRASSSFSSNHTFPTSSSSLPI